MDTAIKNISDLIKRQAEAVSEASEVLSAGNLPEHAAFAIEKSRMNSIDQIQTLVVELTRLYTSGDTGGKEDE